MTERSQLQLFAPEARTEPDWNVRVSPRARRLSVRVYPEGRVEIVAPAGVGARRVQQFVTEHRAWIDRQLREFERAGPVQDRGLPQRLELPALGRSLGVDYDSTGARIGVRVVANGDAIRVATAGASQIDIARALRRWLTGYAKPQIAARLDALSSATGLRYSGLQLRCQRTRWGSCSARGTISINVCIAFLDSQLLRYLLLHELCHTREMNHTHRFWGLVAAYETDYRRLDRQLSAGWRSVPGWIFR
jgi:predicted metal-dependent hydrolase